MWCILRDKDLKNAGLKVTSPRLKILDILNNADGKHLTAEEIYNALKTTNQDVSLATVYRVLSQFEMADLIQKHFFEKERAVFELNTNKHHDHIICVKCAKVLEFYDKEIEKRQEEVAKKKGFTMTSHALHIFGVCKDCQ